MLLSVALQIGASNHLTRWLRAHGKRFLQIAPVQCKSLWRQFKAETEYTVTQAIDAQEAYKLNNWLPPPWAIVAILILGFNEFMTLLSFLGSARHLWRILKWCSSWDPLAVHKLCADCNEPSQENSRRFFPGRLADEGQRPAAPEPQRNPELESKSFRNGVHNNSASDVSSNLTDGWVEYSSPVR